MMRRSFLFYGLGMLAAVKATPETGQRAIMQNEKAVICEGNTTTCPACKKETCLDINAPLVVGNGSRDYPAEAQLFDKIVIECRQCGALFIRR